MPAISPLEAGGKNVCAFLDMLAWSEIGPDLLRHSQNGYNVMVGSTAVHPFLFYSYATHPNVYNRKYNSTAAGRYQLLGRYYSAYKMLLKLPDFSPISQDRIAIQQIKEQHAFEDIIAGKLSDAIANVSNIWASLPGAGYGQHENHLSRLKEAYIDAGGSIA